MTMQDLIVFPSDAIFVPVDENPEARVYLFKFKNSTMDRWLFFWMQDGDTSKVRVEDVRAIGEELNDFLFVVYCVELYACPNSHSAVLICIENALFGTVVSINS